MRWKWVLLIGIFLLIAMTATVYAILTSYDYNKLKPQIARMVEERTGRRLTFNGGINLEIGLSTTLAVDNVTLANAPWGSQPDMIKIQQLQAQVRLLPLLAGDVKLKQIYLDGVDALLETDPTGSVNWKCPSS